MLTDLVQAIINGLGTLTNVVYALPVSPFVHVNAVVLDNEILGMIAWFIPFGPIIGLLQGWLIAIAVWYMAKKGLRWMKMIQ